MSERKVTGWYPPEISPCRDFEHCGRYETLPGESLSLDEAIYYFEPYKLVWTGTEWRSLYGKRMWDQTRYWRGLTERAT